MKRINLFLIIALMLSTLAGCNKNENPPLIQVPVQDKSFSLKSASFNDKYIVILNDDAGIAGSDRQVRNGKIRERAHSLLNKHSVSTDIEDVFETALQGFTARMTFDQAKKIAADGIIKSIEPDQIIALSPIEMECKPGPKNMSQQRVPWGIRRVGGVGRGINKTAWIIDTGIDLNHPDLNVDVYRSVTFLGPRTTPDDENGHGTHVAGIIAAKNNRIGVAGVAAGAKVVSVRVLDRKGNGTISAVISGINYVAANAGKGDVANMSLGGGISDALDEAVLTASLKLKFVLAAGNDADNTNNCSPARVECNNVYTISAMGKGDKWADFSNYGNPPVDYCAPGVDIYSTYKGGHYATMTGTSQAAPHVAGLLLLGNVNPDGFVRNDPDDVPDPIAHK